MVKRFLRFLKENAGVIVDKSRLGSHLYQRYQTRKDIPDHVAPHEGKELEMMHSGHKHAAIILDHPAAREFAHKHGWSTDHKISPGSLHIGRTKEHLDAINHAFKLPYSNTRHRALGKALGYNHHEIETFVTHFNKKD